MMPEDKQGLRKAGETRVIIKLWERKASNDQQQHNGEKTNLLKLVESPLVRKKGIARCHEEHSRASRFSFKNVSERIDRRMI